MLFFILFLIILNKITENFEPNDTQYMICNDLNKYNGNNYKIVNNKLDKPLTGFYSSLLDHAHNRDYNKYFNTPICEYKYDFNNDFMDLNRKINLDGNEKYLVKEKIKLENELNDPFEKYSKVNENYSVEYSDENVKKRFIDGHKKLHNL